MFVSQGNRRKTNLRKTEENVYETISSLSNSTPLFFPHTSIQYANHLNAYVSFCFDHNSIFLSHKTEDAYIHSLINVTTVFRYF